MNFEKLALFCDRSEKRPVTSLGPRRVEESDDEEDLTEHEDKYCEDIVSERCSSELCF